MNIIPKTRNNMKRYIKPETLIILLNNQAFICKSLPLENEVVEGQLTKQRESVDFSDSESLW